MTYKIVLRVAGVDFDDESTLMIISEQLADLSWASIDGRVTGTLFTDATDPVSAAVDASHLIEYALRCVQVDRVDEELCGIADITAWAEAIGSWRKVSSPWTEVVPPTAMTVGPHRSSWCDLSSPDGETHHAVQLRLSATLAVR